MRAGDNYQVSAVTVPDDMALTWSSSNDSVATVDQNGLVTGVSSGDAVISASFDYEGETYTGTANASVHEYDVEMVFTSPGYWEDESLWVKQDFAGRDERQTYMDYIPDMGMVDSDGNEFVGGLQCIYNPDGEQSTIYVDISPKSKGFVYDENKDYFFDLVFFNEIAYDTVFNVSFLSRLFAADGWSPYNISAGDSGSVILPLAVGDLSHERLFTLQIRADAPPPYGPMDLQLALLSKPKA